ncbi:hypothetical protein ES703_78505 [subsurface metagenome]
MTALQLLKDPFPDRRGPGFGSNPLFVGPEVRLLAG